MSFREMHVFDARPIHLVESPETSRYFPSDPDIYTIKGNENVLGIYDKIINDRNRVKSLAVVDDDNKVIGGLNPRAMLLYIHERLDCETGKLKEEYGGGGFKEHMESVTARDIAINTMHPYQPSLCRPINADRKFGDILGAINVMSTDNAILYGKGGEFLSMFNRWDFVGLMSKTYPIAYGSDEYLSLSDKPPYVTRAESPKKQIKGLLSRISQIFWKPKKSPIKTNKEISDQSSSQF